MLKQELKKKQVVRKVSIRMMETFFQNSSNCMPVTLGAFSFLQ